MAKIDNHFHSLRWDFHNEIDSAASMSALKAVMIYLHRVEILWHLRDGASRQIDHHAVHRATRPV